MNQILTELNKASTLKQVIDLLHQILLQTLQNSIIITVQLDEKRDMGYVNKLSGINRPILNKAISLIGIHPVGKYFKNTSYGKKYVYSAMHFTQFTDNLYELSGRFAPHWVFRAVEKIIRIDQIHYIGLISDNQALGSLIIFTKGDDAKLLAGLEDLIHAFSKKMKYLLDEYNNEILGVCTRERFTSALLSNISHEIRTPLNGIIGLMDAGLRLLDENEDTKELTKIIWQNSNELTSKLDNLILISEFESKSISFKMKTINIDFLDEVISNTVRTIQLEHRNRQISYSKPGDLLPFKTILDPYFLEITLKELINNALKFSTKDILLKLHTLKKQVLIEVIDKGIGISTEEQGQLFNRFYKRNNNNSSISGLGIGLSIVKYIAQHHLWSLKLFSELDKGTRVQISLPLTD